MVTIGTKTKGEHDLRSLEHKPNRSTSKTFKRPEDHNRF
jgi:hypothetical protein